MTSRSLKIAFRVDADTLVGTGHLMEVITLIKAFRKNLVFKPLVLTKYAGFTVDKLKKNSIRNLFFIPKNMPELKEAKEVSNILRKENCAGLVTDLLNYSNNYYKYLSARVKNLFVILDTDEAREVPAAVAVNFSITQDKKFYYAANKYRTRYLIGPGYFPFNAEIEKFKPARHRKSVKNIFLNMGGGDPYSLTAKAIKTLSSLDQRIIVNVVIGGAFRTEDIVKLRSLGSRLSGNFRFYADIPQKQMYALMSEADLAITAAGNTLYELAYFGVPCIVLSHHARHLKVAKAFEKRNAVISLGVGTRIPERKLAQETGSLIDDPYLRKKLSLRINSIISAEGTRSITSEILKQLKSND